MNSVRSVSFVALAASFFAAQGAESLAKGADNDTAASAVLADPDGLGGGLVSLSAGIKDGRRSIWGKFDRDGHPLHFETRRGRPRVDREEGVPEYEIDVCFKDESGHPLLVSIAGDEVLIPECDPEREAQARDGQNARNPGAVRASRKPDYERALGAIEALKQVKFRKSYEPEYKELLAQASLVTMGMNAVIHPDAIREEQAMALQSNAAGEDPNEDPGLECEGCNCPVVGESHNTGYRHYIQVHSAPVDCGRYDPVDVCGHGTHGAVAAWRARFGDGFSEYVWERRNHGRHWYEMPLKCAFASAYNRGSHVHKDGCLTPYNVFSLLGGHNCNDDTYNEYRTVRLNQHVDSYGGTCSDAYPRINTPSCW